LVRNAPDTDVAGYPVSPDIRRDRISAETGYPLRMDIRPDFMLKIYVL
jgi:hypothetical protein